MKKIIFFFIFIVTFNQQSIASSIKIPFPNINWEQDPSKIEDMYNYTIAKQIYRSLFRTTADGRIVPDLVKQIYISEDKKKWRFQIIESTFSNGDKLTAQHVVDTFIRIFRSGSSISADLFYIEGSNEIKNNLNYSGFGVKALSESEVEFNLKKPSFLFTQHLATPDTGILNINKLGTISKGYSGTYKIESNSIDATEITKWRKGVLDSASPPIKITFFKSKSNQPEELLKYKADTLDYLEVNPKLTKELISSGWKQSVTESAKTWFVILNQKQIPNSTRYYLIGVVNQKELSDAMENGMSALYGIIPQVLSGSLDEVTFKKNVPKFKNYTKSVIELDYPEDSTVGKFIAKYLEKVWNNSKISIHLNPLKKDEYFNRLFHNKSMAIIGTKAIDYFDGYSELSYFRSGISSNYFGMQSKKFDKLLDSTFTEVNEYKRSNNYKKLQEQITSTGIFIPLLAGSNASGLWSNKLKIVPPHPLGIHSIPMESIEVNE